MSAGNGVSSAFSAPVVSRCAPAIARIARRTAAACLALAAGLWLTASGHAQQARSGLFGPGSMAVTGFSGTASPPAGEKPSPDAAPDGTAFIDTNGAALRVFDVSRLGSPAAGQLVSPPPPFEVTAGEIGQVFGLAYDDGMREGRPSGVPNLYAAATSLYGLRIVRSAIDGSGRLVPVQRGAAGAAFMDGQFGAANGGGPGTIWKIDGMTGRLSKFADIAANRGPGIGGLAFDPDHRQFFASDLDSGLIHRIDAAGKPVDAFDHGVSARPAQKLSALADDGSEMDIRNAAFDSADPASWGYTQDARRVWAVAWHGGRLYYSVGAKAEIWSVGIASSGAFAADPRRELAVKPDDGQAVTAIAFDNRGFLYLARRAPVEGVSDSGRFAQAGRGEVLRYVPVKPEPPATGPAWSEAPEDYATGFAAGNRQASGGADLQYGYDAKGDLDTGKCDATLAVTGDRLRDNPDLAARLTPGGAAVVHGVQLTPSRLVKPGNVPPFGSWFVDFDGRFDDPKAEGHVGAVGIWRPCESRAGLGVRTPGAGAPLPSPQQSGSSAMPAAGPVPAEEGCEGGRPCGGRHDGGGPGIRVEKTGDRECRAGRPCSFEITIANDGDAPFSGPVRIGDAIGADGIGRLEGVAITRISPPFGCAPEPSTLPLSCIASLSLGPHESRVHKVVVVIPDDGRLPSEAVSGRNCVGVLPPDVPVRGAGGTASPASGKAAEDGKAYACHPFVIRHEPKKACKPGLVMSEAGKCVCPQGGRLRDGRCVKEGGQPPTPPPVRQCKLKPGQIRTAAGECVCPRGTDFNGRRCVRVEKPQPQACQVRGQIRTKRGKCVCPRGTEVVRGACRKLPQLCPQGMRYVEGECVPTGKRRCPRGTVGRFPYCEPVFDGPIIEVEPGIIERFVPRRRPRQEQGDPGGRIPNRRYLDDGFYRD